LKLVLSGRIRHLKNNIERTRFSRWLGKKMRRMWLGREIVVVGLPTLVKTKLDLTKQVWQRLD